MKKKVLMIIIITFVLTIIVLLTNIIIDKLNTNKTNDENGPKVTLNKKTDDIKVSSDGVFKYSVKNQSIVGLNNLETTDFIYYDSTYFDIYNYDKKEITIPSVIDNVKILKISSFNIGGLEEITVEKGIEEISDYCFVGATSLKKIKLPKDIKLGNNAFGNRKVEIIYY